MCWRKWAQTYVPLAPRARITSGNSPGSSISSKCCKETDQTKSQPTWLEHLIWGKQILLNPCPFRGCVRWQNLAESWGHSVYHKQWVLKNYLYYYNVLKILNPKCSQYCHLSKVLNIYLQSDFLCGVAITFLLKFSTLLLSPWHCL